MSATAFSLFHWLRGYVCDRSCQAIPGGRFACSWTSNVVHLDIMEWNWVFRIFHQLIKNSHVLLLLLKIWGELHPDIKSNTMQVSKTQRLITTNDHNTISDIIYAHHLTTLTWYYTAQHSVMFPDIHQPLLLYSVHLPMQCMHAWLALLAGISYHIINTCRIDRTQAEQPVFCACLSGCFSTHALLFWMFWVLSFVFVPRKNDHNCHLVMHYTCMSVWKLYCIMWTPRFWILLYMPYQERTG